MPATLYCQLYWMHPSCPIGSLRFTRNRVYIFRNNPRTFYERRPALSLWLGIAFNGAYRSRHGFDNVVRSADSVTKHSTTVPLSKGRHFSFVCAILSYMEKPKLTPKDFFLQLGIVAALYVSVISLINLLFQTVDYAFPDQLAYYGDPYSDGIRVAIASLIIIFPLYLLLSWYVEKLFRVAPEKRELGVRRWLMYFTLFLAGIAIIVDLVALINAFLGGELSARFALKTLAVLVVAGGVFGYYLSDLRRIVGMPSKNKVWCSAAVIIALGSMVLGFFIMGSPFAARERRFDDERVSGLQGIQWQIVNYWQMKSTLPESLSELDDSLSGYRAPSDPETGEPYEYEQAAEGLSFNLCAEFNRSTIGEKERLAGRGGFYPKAMPMYDGSVSSGEPESWEHEAGRFCFKRTIDPERYPAKPRKS